MVKNERDRNIGVPSLTTEPSIESGGYAEPRPAELSEAIGNRVLGSSVNADTFMFRSGRSGPVSHLSSVPGYVPDRVIKRAAQLRGMTEKQVRKDIKKRRRGDII